MKKSLTISILGIIQLFLNLFFQIFILNVFGVGNALDIYYASNTINLIITAISVGAINFAFTPIFIDYFSKNKLNDLKEIANSLFNIIFIVFLFLSIIQWLFASQLVKVILPGFTSSELELTVLFFKIFAFVSIVTISNALLRSLYYTFDKFYTTIYYSIIGLVIQFFFVYFSYQKLSLFSLVYGIIANQLIVFVLMSIPIFKFYKPKIKWTKNFKSALKNIAPLIVSSSFSKSNILIDRFFASMLLPGSITLLYYGEFAIKAISGFVNKGISLVSLRKFSFYSDDIEKFEKLFYFVNKVIIFICIPLLFAIAFFFEDTLKIVVISDKLSSEDVNKLYLVIVSLLGMFIGGNLSSTLTNVFYAKKLTVLISKVNIGTQVFGIILKILLFYIFGFWGLPIAFSFTSLTNTLVLFYLYNTKINKLHIGAILKYLFKVIVISLIAAGVSKLFVFFYFEHWLMIIFIDWLIFTSIYLLLSLKYEKDISHIIRNRIINK